MSDPVLSASRLVGDIGGTNTRLALFDATTKNLRHVHAYKNRDYPSLEDVIQEWLDGLDDGRPENCCLAVAAPPFDDHVTMLNMDWSFSRSGIAKRFGFSQIRCINDFEGNAYALPHLQAEDVVRLRDGEPGGCRKLATVGPGTGLGGATLEFCIDTPVANASEPGHMGLSPANALEIEIFSALLPRHEQVWAELLVSGPGLKRLYETLAKVRGEQAEALDPAAISAQALSGDAMCTEALEVFCGLLGSVCGDYVLATGSYGGLYLAGGILPQLVPVLQSSEFQQRFDSKGEMASVMCKVPLLVITCGTTGLLGAAHCPL